MNFFEIASFGIHESFFMGIFHGILFSLPLSIPFLISLRYFLLKGLSFGFISLFGVLCGQLVFFVVLSFGIRPLILLWYSMEPILAFVGVGLTFQLATDFYHQKKFFNINRGDADTNQSTGRGGVSRIHALFAQASPLQQLGSFNFNLFERYLPLEKIKIFFFQFCLIFLNPVFPALSTRLILSQDILSHFSLLYTSGFFIGSILCVGSFLFFLKSLHFLFTEVKTRDYAVDTVSQFVNNCFVFCILGLLLHGSFQYTWRFITHYPFEFFSIPVKDSNEGTGAQARLLPLPAPKPYFGELLREFPTQDSNIRHREKTLPVERHLPIERINLRRNLSGRPPLNEEQKSDASTKYNSFFLNKIENIFENLKIHFRENLRINIKGTGAYEIKRQAYKLNHTSEIEKRDIGLSTIAAKPVLTPVWRNWGEALFAGPALQTNKTKGKPQFSYIRHLFYTQGRPRGVPVALPRQAIPSSTVSAKPSLTNVSAHEIALNPYIHDDLSVYYTLSKDANGGSKK